MSEECTPFENSALASNDELQSKGDRIPSQDLSAKSTEKDAGECIPFENSALALNDELQSKGDRIPSQDLSAKSTEKDAGECIPFENSALALNDELQSKGDRIPSQDLSAKSTEKDAGECIPFENSALALNDELQSKGDRIPSQDLSAKSTEKDAGECIPFENSALASNDELQSKGDRIPSQDLSAKSTEKYAGECIPFENSALASNDELQSKGDRIPSQDLSANSTLKSAEESFFKRFDDGEAFARQNIQQQWFRYFVKLQADAELEVSTIEALKGAGMGRPDPFEDQLKGSGLQYARNRALSELVYEALVTCGEVSHDEDVSFTICCLVFEETIERQALEEEAMAMLTFVDHILKPKALWRYDFAWGIMRGICARPSLFDWERVRCSERHKPLSLRIGPRTCVLPIDLNTLSDNFQGTTPLALLAMGSSSS